MKTASAIAILLATAVLGSGCDEDKMMSEIEAGYKSFVIGAKHQPLLEAEARKAFKSKSWTRARRELEPDAEVDQYGYLKVPLPSITVDSGPLLTLMRKLLKPHEKSEISHITINHNLKC